MMLDTIALHMRQKLETGGVAVKYNDDGEPQGTAGAPILKLILEKGLSNILVIVTRYFGGILLGTGGLVRAYSGAVEAALEKAQIIQKITILHILFQLTKYLEYLQSNKKMRLEQQLLKLLLLVLQTQE